MSNGRGICCLFGLSPTRLQARILIELGFELGDELSNPTGFSTSAAAELPRHCRGRNSELARDLDCMLRPELIGFDSRKPLGLCNEYSLSVGHSVV